MFNNAYIRGAVGTGGCINLEMGYLHLQPIRLYGVLCMGCVTDTLILSHTQKECYTALCLGTMPVLVKRRLLYLGSFLWYMISLFERPFFLFQG